MIPSVDGVASDAGRVPMMSGIIPDIPLMAAGNAALMSPDERMTTEELIDVEFQSLRESYVVGEEVDVISEIVDVGNDGVIEVRQTLRREVANQVIVPKNIGVLSVAADIVLSRISADRRRAHAGPSRPGCLRTIRGARGADVV